MELFQHKYFAGHAGVDLDYKIDADALSDASLETLAFIVGQNWDHANIVSVPRGGDRFAEKLKRYQAKPYKYTLIVDDVLTTGISMERVRRELQKTSQDQIFGLVIFSRNSHMCPDWVTPMFQLHNLFRDKQVRDES